MPRKRPPTARRPRAFSLIETLVVVGIIAILVSLVIAGGAMMNTRAKQSQTRGVLAALAAIDTEYRAQTNLTVNDNVSVQTKTPMDWSEQYEITDPVGRRAWRVDNPEPAAMKKLEVSGSNLSIKRFIVAAWQISATKSMIENLANNTKNLEISNPDGVTNWASYTAAGGSGFAEIVDGWGNPIEYRAQEIATGIFPVHPTPFFVSAGPDGKFGSAKDTASAADKAAAADNLFSYDLE